MGGSNHPSRRFLSPRPRRHDQHTRLKRRDDGGHDGGRDGGGRDGGGRGGGGYGSGGRGCAGRGAGERLGGHGLRDGERVRAEEAEAEAGSV